ncbi:hypothetical protein [Nonlabens agnitus]|uniref:Uncharacterized protein n=1 Tax=Nonlabens agnitus TaxID=870484 RepID=A0A2S9WQB6_9FLAO|nr:hypothetical protein [Nonlabens agnitus]PRP65661.1 hypothetical protein BST86_00430 [Nonlabens agnitus]
MKQVLLILMVFAFAKADFLQAQVHIDMVNAPMNPVGKYYTELPARNVKGSVYSVEYTRYSRDGKLEYQPSDYSLQEAITYKKPFIEMKNGLITVEKPSYSDSPSYYAYDGHKCLTREENDFWIHSYSYDSRKRLMETSSYRKEDKTTKTTKYTYELKGDMLWVTSTNTNSDGTTYFGTTKFKDGLKMELSWGSDPPIKYEYTFDHKGNWITQKVINPRYTTTITGRSIVYYDDVDKIVQDRKLKWEKLPFVEGSKVVIPYVMLHGRPVSKQWMGGRSINNGALFYIDVGQHYYLGDGGYVSNEDLGVKGIAPEVAAGSPYVMEHHDGYINFYDKGLSLKNFKSHYYGNSYYVLDSTLQRHYIVPDYKSENGFYNAELKIGDYMAYGQDPQKNEFQIIENGVLVEDYSNTSWKTIENGDFVFMKAGKPVYVLTGSAANTEKKLYLGRKYNGEKLFDFQPKKSESASSVETVPFNTNATIEVKKKGETTFQFYQNGLRIENPKYFIKAQGDMDLLFGYGLEDFVISDYKNIEMDGVTNARRIAKENEVIVMYKDGKAAYFYNNGVTIPPADYAVTVVQPGRWLVYLKKLNKTIFVDIENKNNSRFGASYTYSANDWIHKNEKGVNLFSNGEYIKLGTFKFYLDKAGNAHFYINEKPAYYLANYSSKTLGNYALAKHKGQTFKK